MSIPLNSRAPEAGRSGRETIAAVLLGAILFALLCWIAASSSGASYQRMRMLEIEQENAAACARLGFSVAGDAQTACKLELMNVRELHTRRLAAESLL